MSRRRLIELHGQALTAEERAELRPGLTARTIRQRLRNGWPVAEALDTPPVPRGYGRDSFEHKEDGCRGCVHHKLLHYSAVSAYHVRYCAYILDTGHRRPCPAGALCTEYKQARRGQKGKL